MLILVLRRSTLVPGSGDERGGALETQEFHFDHAFGPAATTADVHEDVAAHAPSNILDGYNGYPNIMLNSQQFNVF